MVLCEQYIKIFLKNKRLFIEYFNLTRYFCKEFNLLKFINFDCMPRFILIFHYQIPHNAK